MAVIAAHLGETDEEKLNNMSYIWFNQVLEALGKRLNYEMVIPMNGRTVFDKKSGEAVQKIIQEANPLFKHRSGINGAAGIMSLPGTIKKIKADDAAGAAALDSFFRH